MAAPGCTRTRVRGGHAAHWSPQLPSHSCPWAALPVVGKASYQAPPPALGKGRFIFESVPHLAVSRHHPIPPALSACSTLCRVVRAHIPQGPLRTTTRGREGDRSVPFKNCPTDPWKQNMIACEGGCHVLTARGHWALFPGSQRTSAGHQSCGDVAIRSQGEKQHME